MLKKTCWWVLSKTFLKTHYEPPLLNSQTMWKWKHPNLPEPVTRTKRIHTSIGPLKPIKLYIHTMHSSQMHKLPKILLWGIYISFMLNKSRAKNKHPKNVNLFLAHFVLSHRDKHQSEGQTLSCTDDIYEVTACSARLWCGALKRKTV